MYPSGHDLTVCRQRLDVARQPDTAYERPTARETKQSARWLRRFQAYLAPDDSACV